MIVAGGLGRARGFSGRACGSLGRLAGIIAGVAPKPLPASDGEIPIGFSLVSDVMVKASTFPWTALWLSSSAVNSTMRPDFRTSAVAVPVTCTFVPACTFVAGTMDAPRLIVAIANHEAAAADALDRARYFRRLHAGLLPSGSEVRIVLGLKQCRQAEHETGGKKYGRDTGKLLKKAFLFLFSQHGIGSRRPTERQPQPSLFNIPPGNVLEQANSFKNFAWGKTPSRVASLWEATPVADLPPNPQKSATGVASCVS